MYNSSLKDKGSDKTFVQHAEIQDRVFFNDMSKNYMCEAFRSCDVIFSEIAWSYGYNGFNEKAGNAPNPYSDYLDNLNKMIEELGVPAFIICGKPAKSHFPKAEMHPIVITTSQTNIKGCQVYVWNFNDYDALLIDNTNQLTSYLASRFRKCLDPSCGYGEHLLKFSDFVGCDINRDCLTYLTILTERRDEIRAEQ